MKEPKWMKEAYENPQQHRMWVLERMIADEVYAKEKNNDYHKPLNCMLGPDTDGIPKVQNAGFIVDDVEIPYQIMHNGIKVVKGGYNGVCFERIIYGLKGHQESQEEKVFHEVLATLTKNATMIEIGSAWAYYSLWFCHKIENARTIMVEPHLRELNVGKQNYKLNSKEGQFIHGWIGMKPHLEDIQYAKETSIDTLVKELSLDHIHIVHADIQGEEHAMLTTAASSIANGLIDYFFISTHGDSVHAECKRHLINYNYTIIAEHSINESYSYDGLLVAKRAGVKGPEHVSISKSKPYEILEHVLKWSERSISKMMPANFYYSWRNYVDSAIQQIKKQQS